MTCYLCGGGSFCTEADHVRDRDDIGVVRCLTCGLVSLTRVDHISEGFYRESGMHAGETPNLDHWVRTTGRDDERRFQHCREMALDKRVLDVGSGTGEFLKRIRSVARVAEGVEPEAAVRAHYSSEDIKLFSDVSEIEEKYDLVTLFHVLEHVPDPREFLAGLRRILADDGTILIEVPNSEDALLTLYESVPFRAFTFWSCHLYLFSAATLAELFRQIGARSLYIHHVQRYPLSNHVHWLAKGQPGGHAVWSFLDSPELSSAYAARLAGCGMTDTLLASISFDV